MPRSDEPRVAAPDLVIDVRSLPPGTCRARIEDAFDHLPVGAALELRVPHDPSPLRLRFARERPGASAWTALEDGPITWRMRVERLA